MKYIFTAKLWQWSGSDSWHFISLPSRYTEEIKLISNNNIRGFGSVRVEAVVGKSTWKTSIFPDSKNNCYLLPVKKEIRQNENLLSGDEIPTSIKLLI